MKLRHGKITMIWPRSLEFLIDWEPLSGCLKLSQQPMMASMAVLLAVELLQREDHSTVLVSQGPLLRWLKVNFSEAFVAWIHVKALRVFVESVLRWVNTECRQRFLGKSKCTALFLVQFVCGRNPYTPCFVLCVPYTLHSRSSQETIQMSTKKVTYELDEKLFLGGTYREGENRHCLADFWLQKENAFQWGGSIVSATHHQWVCLEAEEGEGHEQTAVTLPSRCSCILCSEVWPPCEFPSNAAAAKQEVCEAPERCPEHGLQTPGWSCSSKYNGCTYFDCRCKCCSFSA